MYLGRVVESAPTLELVRAAQHPYTQALLAAVPRLDGKRGERAPLPGEAPAVPCEIAGCAFHPRCARAADRCRAKRPSLRPIAAPDHLVACHLPGPNHNIAKESP